ncbi:MULTISPECIES: hypothetical protein [Cyclobacterium]|uniref:Uncharacterized protein n=1 Tax=Cyclobacterium jeungdonense TaxID=708087 RepID=A0ABT8C8D6_9BACT|nr:MULTISPECIES: hypothetical protein [Cyclobacterium]MBD3627647.1 hypothetical protein [Cyclobacterium sp.]MDN3689063.1 hypothetical protein [Cyclobacterium jeungdonense]
METIHRNRYLGIETDPQENRKFKVRLAICLTAIAFATCVMLAQETRSIYKGKVNTTIRKAQRAGRKVKSLFQ